MEKILEGNVGSFEVPDLLTFLNMGRRTGVLVMERIEQETKIFFRDGQPIFSTSSRDELRVPRLLERRGTDPELLKKVAPRLQFPAGDEAIGAALVSVGVLRREELGPFMKQQVSEVIFDTFEWTDGVFTFYDGIPPPATAVTLEIDLQNLMMEGVRRIDERERLEELFPDRELVAESVANPERVKASVTLTAEEWRVFFLVDGRRNLDEICSLAGVSDQLATLQVVHNLIAANLITLVAPTTSLASMSPVQQPPPPPAAEEPPAAAPAPPVRRGRAAAPEAAPPAPAEKEEREDEVRVERGSAPPARPASPDTKEIVNPRAAPYLDNARQMAVARLVIRKEGEEDRSFPLSRDSSTLGRHRNNDVVVSDAKVSSFHARIDRTAEGHKLVDLGSRNGTFVNGNRVTEVLLSSGDEVRVGTAKLSYLVDYTTPVA